MRVTIFKDIRSTSTPFYRHIDVVIDRIKTGSSRELIEAIQLEPDKSTRNEMKKSLPAICFSGVFTKRQDNSIVEHSGLICLDFDGYTTKKQMMEEKKSIAADGYVFSVFVSPSGDGLKVLVKIPQDIDNHVKYFNALQRHFDSPHFDTTSKNISRVCYESYDKNIYVNYESEVWSEMYEEEYVEVKKSTDAPTIPITNENKIVDILLKWWTAKYGMVDGERNQNVYILAAAFNDYGVNKSLAEYIIGQFEQADFPMSEIRTTINSAYSHTSKFGTKYYEDTGRVSQLKKKVKDGASPKQIKSEMTDIPEDVIDAVLEKIDSQTKRFWTKNDKGAVSIVHNLFKEFLEDNGFYKFYPENSKTFNLVKVTNNLIDNTSEDEIKDFILSYLEDMDDLSVYNYFADKTRFFKEDFLSMLGSVDVYFVEDTTDTAHLYYNNCAVKVTKDRVEIIDYIDLDGYIWKEQVIDRDFAICEVTECDFKTFVSNISGDDKQRVRSVESTIGFLMHGYKNPAYCPAVILNDEVISDNPEGGTGKGIFVRSISKLKRTVYIDGKSFNFDKSFAYQTVDVGTQVLSFDDVKKHFDFERLFSVVTEGITVEKKNKDAFNLSFRKSPKIIITTNYAVRGKGNSFERRKWELEFKQFYSKEFTPYVEFGRMMFDDWDEEEWCKFDNYMINNLKSYLSTGLIKSEFVNLKVRKLSAETCHEFIEWCGIVDGDTTNDRMKIGEVMYKQDLYLDFIMDNPDFAPKAKMTISRTLFYKWLVSYGVYVTGVAPLEGRDSNGRWIKFVAKEGETHTNPEFKF
jgi:hypothetical protein